MLYRNKPRLCGPCVQACRAHRSRRSGWALCSAPRRSPRRRRPCRPQQGRTSLLPVEPWHGHCRRWLGGSAGGRVPASWWHRHSAAAGRATRTPPAAGERGQFVRGPRPPAWLLSASETRSREVSRLDVCPCKEATQYVVQRTGDAACPCTHEARLCERNSNFGSAMFTDPIINN